MGATDLDEFDPMDHVSEPDEDSAESGEADEETPDAEPTDEDEQPEQDPEQDAEGSEEEKDDSGEESGEEEPQKLGLPETATVKVNGQEREIQLPQTADEVTQLATKAAGADDVFRQASEMKKEAKQVQEQFSTLVDAIHNNPEEVLRQAGHDLNKMAEEALLRQIELEKMDPSKRKELELQQREERLKQQEQQSQQQQRQAQTEQLTQQYTQVLREAAKQAGLPVDSQLLWERLSSEAQNRFDADPEPDELAQAAPEIVEAVRSRYYEEAPSLLKDLPADKLVEIIGEDKLKELRERDLARVKSPKQQPKAKRGVKAKQSTAPKRRKPAAPKTLDELEDAFEERYGI